MELEQLEVVKNPILENNSFDINNFKQNLKIEIIELKDNSLEFDMIGVDVSIANAIRRIILSDIPSCAIEKVLVANNTSIVPDEVIAHRLGLVPINFDPQMLNYPDNNIKLDQLDDLPPNQVLVFNLTCKCTILQDNTIQNSAVTSGMLQWIPIGNQTELFGGIAPKPLHDDIILVKLNPGQEVDMTMICVKGIGRDHAKFSPVSNVSYRLYPEIKLKQPFYGDDARLLKNYFSPGVIELVDHPKYGVEAKVVNCRADSNSRNIKHDEKFKDLVILGRRYNHFIFTVESIGVYRPERLIIDAVRLLKNKAKLYINELSSNNIVVENSL